MPIYYKQLCQFVGEGLSKEEPRKMEGLLKKPLAGSVLHKIATHTQVAARYSSDSASAHPPRKEKRERYPSWKHPLLREVVQRLSRAHTLSRGMEGGCPYPTFPFPWLNPEYFPLFLTGQSQSQSIMWVWRSGHSLLLPPSISVGEPWW